LGQATVSQVQARLPDPPTRMAVRRTLHILEEKGHLRRGKRGREVLYIPTQRKRRAGLRAFQNVLDTYFAGSLESAMAAHLISKNPSLSKEAKQRLSELIEQTREEEDKR
jgi:predicted transcriptional regulator